MEIELSDMLALVDCEDARAFLAKVLEIRYRKRGRVNYADFSRRAGFASRSFLSEYLAGTKRLSADSLFKIKSSLRLSADGARLFELLVYREQRELRPRNLNENEIQKGLQQVRRFMMERVGPGGSSCDLNDRNSSEATAEVALREVLGYLQDIARDRNSYVALTEFPVDIEQVATFKRELRDLVAALISKYKVDSGGSTERLLLCLWNSD